MKLKTKQRQSSEKKKNSWKGYFQNQIDKMAAK